MLIITIGMNPLENGWIWSFQFSFRDMPTNFKISEVVGNYLDIIHRPLVFRIFSNTWDYFLTYIDYFFGFENN